MARTFPALSHHQIPNPNRQIPSSQFPQNPASSLVGLGQFQLHFVARQQTNEIAFVHSGRMGQHLAALAQIHPEHQLRQLFHYRSLIPEAGRRLHGLVSTHGPFDVTATQCSKCAEYEPSLVTAVHLSPISLASAFQAYTMGSMASTMPSFKRGFSFLRST